MNVTSNAGRDHLAELAECRRRRVVKLVNIRSGPACQKESRVVHAILEHLQIVIANTDLLDPWQHGECADGESASPAKDIHESVDRAA